MAKEKVSMTIDASVIEQIDRRMRPGKADPDKQGRRSGIVNQALFRYYECLKIGRSHLRRLLTDEELDVILNNGNGIFWGRPIMPPLLWSYVERAIEQNPSHNDKVEAQALIEKLKNLDPIDSCALVDAAERYWSQDITKPDFDFRKALDF